MRIRERLFRFLCLALVAGSPISAQGIPPKEENKEILDDLLALLNTPITAASKRAEKAIEAPSVVSIITRDQFQAYGWTSINEALYSLPGFGPARDYDRRTVASRGLFEGWNNNHILLLVDGIPYNDNIYGSAYTSEITPVFMIKTLEVVRGPGSALYGSNATNSATQLRTITAADLGGGGEAQVRVGSQGDRIYDFALGKEGDLISAVAAFNAFETGGNNYNSYDGSLRTIGNVVDGPLAAFPIHDERNSQYGWLKLTGHGDLYGWNFQFHHQAWDYKTGHGWVWQIPDLGERLAEKRQIAALGYSGKIGEKWNQEYLLRYQKHDINWNIRFYPNNGFGGYYPTGVYEDLDTSASDLFLRGQWSVDLPHGSNLLFGIEGTRFLYEGDKSHHSNVEMATFSPNADNMSLPLGPWLAVIKGKPIITTGFYAQFSSGALLGSMIKGVLGLRSDRSTFDYHKLDATHTIDTGQTDAKSFSKVSPRLALVFTPKSNLAIKAMWGRAFRAPAPSELAGANTLTLGSNIEKLEPETLDTTELAVDWIIGANLNWRTNIYRTKFSNQIAYSAANANLSANIYTLTTQGLETELLFGYAGWRGFVNYSYAKRVDEEILDNTIAANPDKLTWDPGSRFKFGVIYTAGPVVSALTGYYQSTTNRRTTDVGLQPIPLMAGATLDVDAYRARSLDAWFTLDAKVTWNFTSDSSVAAYATNLLDTDKNKLIKIQPFPFDYQGEGRKYGVVLRTRF